MQIYIARLNIEHFRGRLAAETDPKTLGILHRLLDAEKANLVGMLGHAARPSLPAAADESVEHELAQESPP